MISPVDTLMPRLQQYSLFTLAFGFTVIWCVIGLFSLLIPVKNLKYKTDIQNRVVSIMHSTTTIILGGYRLFFTEASFEGQNTFFDNITMCMSLGYFIYDFIFMSAFGLTDKAMTIHHFSCMICYTLCINAGYGGYLTMISLFWAEYSNPVMHARIIIK